MLHDYRKSLFTFYFMDIRCRYILLKQYSYQNTMVVTRQREWPKFPGGGVFSKNFRPGGGVFYRKFRILTGSRVF